MSLKRILITGLLLALGSAFVLGFHLVENSITLWRLRDVEGTAGIYWSVANTFNSLSAVFVACLFALAWLFYEGARD